MTYTALLVGLSPVIVALIRKWDWASGKVVALALVWALIAYIGGRYLDGVQPSIAIEYIQGFGAAVMGQQVLYQLFKGTEWMQSLTGMGGPVQAIVIDQAAEPTP